MRNDYLIILIILILLIISFSYDLVDIFNNGLSLNNNLNKLIMFLILFLSTIILIYEGQKKYHTCYHCVPISGLLIDLVALIDLFILTILDIKQNFDFLKLFKPVGYLVVSIIIIFEVKTIIKNKE